MLGEMRDAWRRPCPGAPIVLSEDQHEPPPLPPRHARGLWREPVAAHRLVSGSRPRHDPDRAAGARERERAASPLIPTRQFRTANDSSRTWVLFGGKTSPMSKRASIPCIEHLERRAVVPARSFHHRRSPDLQPSWPLSGRNSTYRPVQIRRASSLTHSSTSFFTWSLAWP